MHKRTKQFADEISQVKGFYLENDVVFNQLIIRCENDQVTESVLANIQNLRDCWLGGAVWHGKKIIRVSICSWATTEKDITLSISSFKKAMEMEMN